MIRVETDTRNGRAAALLERLGFVQIEKKENAHFFKGSPSHDYAYELLREAWNG